MQKMMTYSEANSVLYSSLSPNNRCLSKAVAIANDANPDLLASFANNRLVPASVVEKAAHAEVLHFFCDENGNNLGTNYTINVPEGQGAIVFYTRILVNGQTPDISWFEKKDWSKVPAEPHIYPYPETESDDHFSYPGEINSKGILRHVAYAPKNTGKFLSDWYLFSIGWSSSAKSAGIDINDEHTIRININPISHPSYNISKTILFFRDKNLGYGESLTINGFDNFTVTKVAKDSKITALGAYGQDVYTADWFSDFTVLGTKLIIHVNWDLRYKYDFNVNDIYKISDGNKTLYLRVTDEYYSNSYVQPGQEGDGTYEVDRLTVQKQETSPDPQSTNNFFLISDTGSGYCKIDTSCAASYLDLVRSNGRTSSTKSRIVVVVPTTRQIAYRSDWFDTEDRSGIADPISREKFVHDILKISDVVSHINTAVSLGAYIFLEAQNNLDTPPVSAYIYNIHPKS